MSSVTHPFQRPTSLVRLHAAQPETAPLGVDHERIARAVREILIAVGEDPDREGLLDTPSRVARAYAETFAGLRENAGTHLARTFEHEATGDDVVLLRNIEFSSMCEHHLAPFVGHAHIAYLPSGAAASRGPCGAPPGPPRFGRGPQKQEAPAPAA